MSRGGSRTAGWLDAADTACLNIAHRGARAHAPENTLEAFDLAVKSGADMIELDVHLSADGHVVVHHDDDLLRCTDAKERFPGRGSYFISDLSLAELRELDAGKWYTGSPSEARVPTLDEVLELAEHHQIFVNIELKLLPRMYRQLVFEVLECIKRTRVEHLTLISSFDHQALREVRALNERIATGVLSSARLIDPVEYLARLDADAYHPSCDAIGLHAAGGALDTATIEALRTAHKQINVWTCNEPEPMMQLAAAGVTGIITDDPHLLFQALVANSLRPQRE